MDINYVLRTIDKETLAHDLEFIDSNDIDRLFAIELNGLIDRKTYDFLKAISKNKDFVEVINDIRAICNIPKEGYGWERWYAYYDEYGSEEYEKIIRKILTATLVKLTPNFPIPSMLYAHMADIIAANHVYLPLFRIEIEIDGKTESHYEGSAVKICIYDNLNSTEELKQYIDANWNTIQKGISKFDDFEKISISERDYRILELKDDFGMPHAAIAKQLMKERNEFVTENTVKNAYSVASKKINNLSRLKKHS